MEAQQRKKKSLGESLKEESGGEDALRWVERSREAQRKREEDEQRRREASERSAVATNKAAADRELASRRARELDEEEQRQYMSDDLRGMKVAHDTSRFAEGEVTFLTLKDAPMIIGSTRGHCELNEDDDVLENVSLAEDERRARAKAEAMPTTYDRYGDSEFQQLDADGGIPVRRRAVLSQYDHVAADMQDGDAAAGRTETSSGFVIGASEENRTRRGSDEEQTGKAAAVAENASYSTMTVAEEFRKPRQQKGLRKRRPVKDDPDAAAPTADTPNDASAVGSGDHGKRETRAERQKERKTADMLRELEQRQKSYDKALAKAREESLSLAFGSNSTAAAGTEGDSALRDEDEELYRSLSKSRATAVSRPKKLSAEEIVAAAVAERKLAADVKMEPTEESGITISAMSEFVNSLSAAVAQPKPTSAPAPLGTSVTAAPPAAAEVSSSTVGVPSASSDVKMEPTSPVVTEATQDEGRMGTSDSEDEEAGVLDEPIVANSVSAALQRLQQQGGIEKFEKASDVQIGRKKDGMFRFGGADDPAPRLKLEYLDNDGRQLRPKEAFRQLSYKFHGKLPMKRKLERLQKRIEEETRVKNMESTDTPLQSVAAFKEIQKLTQTPYLVLSGKGTADSWMVDVKRKPADEKTPSAPTAPDTAKAAKKKKKTT